MADLVCLICQNHVLRFIELLESYNRKNMLISQLALPMYISATSFTPLKNKL